MASKPESIVLGLGLVALGLVWTLSNLGLLDGLAVVRRWWPLSLVVWGALEILAAQRARARGER